MNFLSIILLFGSATTIVCGHSPSYSRSYYSSVVTPTSRYSIHHGGGSTSSAFVPLTYKSDLLPEESKHRSPSKYSRKHTYKGYGSDEDDVSAENYNSDEYSNEAKHLFASKENDSREYTIGTHIRVQHPITVPKKTTISYPTKSTKYPSLSNIQGYSMDVSHEERGSDSYLPSTSSKKQKYSQLYEPDPFHVIAPPKTKSHHNHHQSAAAFAGSYNLYDPDVETYENPDIGVKQLKANLKDRYKGVASKKQIEKYIEDQEKLLDEALKLQLLNSAKFQKLLKSTEKEHHFKQPDFEDEYIANVPPPYRDSFPKSGPPKLTRTRRRPSKSKPSIISKPNRKYRSAFVIEV
ncbi:uncharacterized protein ACRADG_004133 [Cochliomyia hominivorax]